MDEKRVVSRSETEALGKELGTVELVESSAVVGRRSGGGFSTASPRPFGPHRPTGRRVESGTCAIDTHVTK